MEKQTKRKVELGFRIVTILLWSVPGAFVVFTALLALYSLAVWSIEPFCILKTIDYTILARLFLFGLGCFIITAAIRDSFYHYKPISIKDNVADLRKRMAIYRKKRQKGKESGELSMVLVL